MTKRLTFFWLMAVAACASFARQAATVEDGTSVGIERLRAVTRPFHSLDSAVAAGYPRTVAQCLVHEHHGAMGYHHVNQGYLDAKAEVERPEILLYEQAGNGSYRLNGVEFIVPFRFWPRDSIPPTILGQRLKQEDRLNFWYLHAWVWKDNPDGTFADFHPSVACPDSTRRVYTPTPEHLPRTR